MIIGAAPQRRANARWQRLFLTASTPAAYEAVSVLVNGNTYQAYMDPDGVLDDKSMLITTLVSSAFSSGHIGFYSDSSGLSFSHFTVSGTLIGPAAPVITTTAPAQDNAASINIDGTADPNATVALYNGTQLVKTTTADGNGDWQVNGITLSDGADYSFTATASVAGDLSAPSNVLAFHDDQTPPTVTIQSEALSNGRVTLTGTTGEAQDSISVYDGNTLLG